MIKAVIALICLLLLSFSPCAGQSLEFMPGHERIFADVQWLKFVGSENKWSLFSRTRATVTYENQSDIFTGAYLNYTTKHGLGGSIIGKIGSTGGGADAGIHIFKANSTWMLFGLASIGLKNELEYSWFSICRYTPDLTETWKLYTSLELFTLFGREGHLISIQRIRLGLDRQQWQFGLAANLSELGSSWSGQSNLGVFVRKTF